MNKVSLTQKEKQVVEALRSGLLLRPKRFSDLYEIAASFGYRSKGLFTVNRNVIANLESKGAIYVAIDQSMLRTRYFVNDATTTSK